MFIWVSFQTQLWDLPSFSWGIHLWSLSQYLIFSQGSQLSPIVPSLFILKCSKELSAKLYLQFSLFASLAPLKMKDCHYHIVWLLEEGKNSKVSLWYHFSGMKNE